MIEQNLRRPLLSKRIPLRHEVHLRFPHLTGIVTGVCHNISMTGMFVQSRDLAIPPTTLRFELRADSGRSLTGDAEVTWVREKDDGPQRPRGMGLRFVRLGAGGPQAIRRAVEKQILHGGTLADLDELRSMSEDRVDATLQAEIRTESADSNGPREAMDPRKLHPYAGAAAVHAEPGWRRYRGAALAAALVGLALAVAGIVLLL